MVKLRFFAGGLYCWSFLLYSSLFFQARSVIKLYSTLQLYISLVRVINDQSRLSQNIKTVTFSANFYWLLFCLWIIDLYPGLIISDNSVQNIRFVFKAFKHWHEQCNGRIRMKCFFLICISTASTTILLEKNLRPFKFF